MNIQTKPLLRKVSKLASQVSLQFNCVLDVRDTALRFYVGIRPIATVPHIFLREGSSNILEGLASTQANELFSNRIASPLRITPLSFLEYTHAHFIYTFDSHEDKKNVKKIIDELVRDYREQP